MTGKRKDKRKAESTPGNGKKSRRKIRITAPRSLADVEGSPPVSKTNGTTSSSSITATRSSSTPTSFSAKHCTNCHSTTSVRPEDVQTAECMGIIVFTVQNGYAPMPVGVGGQGQNSPSNSLQQTVVTTATTTPANTDNTSNDEIEPVPPVPLSITVRSRSNVIPLYHVSTATQTGNNTETTDSGAAVQQITFVHPEFNPDPEPKNQIGISPVDCANLLKQAIALGGRLVDPGRNDTVLPFAQMTTTILLDCRCQEDFYKTPINFPNIWNVPPFDFDSDAYQEFTLKTEVYKLLQEKCPSFLGKLHSPGYYANIVLVDEASTAKDMSPFLKVLRLAMIKWNETTSTSVKLLDGGFSAFSKQFPEMIEHLPLPGLAALSPVPETAQLNTFQNASTEAMMQGLPTHEKDPDDMQSIMKILISFRQIRHSFGSVKQTLLEEIESIIVKHLEAQFPDTVKCPVCFETYSGHIIQCANGHCICGKCAEKITSCPECRLKYEGAGVNVGKVRNRVLENLLATSLTCVCSCGEQVMCLDVQGHAKVCASQKQNIEEVGNVEAVINMLETEIKKWDMKFEEVAKRNKKPF